MRDKKWRNVRVHKSLNSSRYKTKEFAEVKTCRGRENNKASEFSTTVNMIHVTDNDRFLCKYSESNTPIVLENKYSYVKN